ncbi:response regulator [Paenibacillus sp.]|uniref:response regulator n=1 Tax=Paenibacillus sp. TaxID=58172 RepID=UPI002810ED82|nr:response regulator [Paenibacillus sp.]
MKIKTKLMLGLSALPVLFVLLVAVGWIQNATLKSMSASLQEDYDTAFLAENIHRKVKNEAIYLRNIALFEDDASIDKEIELLQAESESVMADIAMLQSMVETPEQRVLVERVHDVNHEFIEYKDEVVRHFAEGRRAEGVALINERGHEIHDRFFEAISKLTDDLESQMKSALTEVPRDSQRNLFILGMASLLGVVLTAASLYWRVWTVAVRLNRVSGIIASVADGTSDLRTKIEATSQDEIDDVARSFNRMAASLAEQRDRERDEHWLKSHVAEITGLLTGARDAEAVAKAFLSKAVPAVGGCHAVFYAIEPEAFRDEPALKLTASYAFKERKHLANTFLMGEGLIGQAALENAPILLTSVPSDYVTVRSGLGEAPPMNVYVLPISFKEEVLAVVEIASFKPFSPIQQEFLEEMRSYLGIILDSVASRIRLAAMLEQSQALTEELQAQSEELQSQQEELRATNEELEEQTLALRRSEEKLQAQQEELEQTNAELKDKAERLELQNKRFEETNKEIEIARVGLVEQARQLALSSKYKSEFLANMSHELRTPLNSLLILSKLLADNNGGNLTEKQIEYAKIIYSSGSDLLALINDILDLAKIESGKMDAAPSDVRLAELAEFAEASFRAVASEKGLGFRVVLRDGLPETVYSDERRLQQVLRNLLSNAFKFTHEGDVALEIGVADRGKKAIAFSVADTGIGIAEDKLELIFQAFQQADGTTSRKYGGTGLGLSICREIAELLGGEIAVESREGEGSVFTFYVGDYEGTDDARSLAEAAVEAAAAVENAGPPPTPGAVEPTPNPSPIPPVPHIKKLLIVDDDVRQRSSLMELLGGKDVIIKAVPTGKEALEQLKVDTFDCMVLDLGLTDTTGFELLETIKTDGTQEQVTVFIYTGRDLTSKEEIQLKKYAHTIIIKDSHSPERLMDELELFLSSGAGRSEASAGLDASPAERRSGLEGKRALLIDDDVRNVFALSSALEAQGMDVTFAENGAEGLELLERSPPFDIVLTDIMMPEMDGYETIRRLRAKPAFERLPVIALTAKAMREDRERCLEVGASDYIAKPVDPAQLLSLMKVWVYPEGEA